MLLKTPQGAHITYSSKRDYQPKAFRSGEISTLFRGMAQLVDPAGQARLTRTTSLQDGTTVEVRGFDGLDEVCSFERTSISVIGGTPRSSEVYIGIDGLYSPHGSLRVTVSAESPVRLLEAHQFVEKQAGFEPARRPAVEDNSTVADPVVRASKLAQELAEFRNELETQQIARLEADIEALKHGLSALDRRLVCFVSHRFRDQEKQYGLEVQRFLTLIGVKAVSGLGYEPRGISEKVVDRLSQRIDFMVVIVAGNGPSKWVREEAAFGRARGIPTVPLVEQGLEFDVGMHADLEWIPFAPGHIADGFIPLLEAVAYVRATRERSGSPGVA